MNDPDRPLRRDAERNRQLILATARALIAERGLEVTHEAIARAAGIGMGTVYRRYPDRQDLIDTLFAEHIVTVAALAEAARGAPDPWAGLQQFMTGSLELQADDRGLRELLRGARQGSVLVTDARRRITPAVSDLVARAQAAGQLSPELTPGDFELVELMVTGVMDASRASDPALWRRALAIALAGLRAADSLPGTPPSAEEIDGLHRRAATAPR